MIAFFPGLPRREHPVLGPVAHRVLVLERSVGDAEARFGLRGTLFRAEPVDPANVRMAAEDAPELFGNARLAAELASFASSEGYAVHYTRLALGDGELSFGSRFPGEPYVAMGGQTAAMILERLGLPGVAIGYDSQVVFGEVDAEKASTALALTAWPTPTPELRGVLEQLRALAQWCQEHTAPIAWRNDRK